MFSFIKQALYRINHSKENQIRLFCTLILVFFLIALAYHYLMGTYLSKPYPKNTYLFIPKAMFTDFFEFHSGRLVCGNYLPFTAIISKGIVLVSNQYIALIGYYSLILISLISFLYTQLPLKNALEKINIIIIITFLSFPVVFLMDRGNLEGFIFIFLLLFFWFDKTNKPILSTLFLSSAIAIKIYPAIFLFLLLKRKQFKNFFLSCFYVFSFNLIAIMLWGGALSRQSLSKIAYYSKYYIVGNNGLAYGHSAFGLIKIIFFWLKAKIPIIVALKWYTLGVVIFFCFILLYLFFIENKLWKIIAVLTLCMCLLPYTSPNYKLIHLFFPLLYFFNETKVSPYDTIITLLFGLLFVPKNYRLLSHHYDGVIADPIIIMILLLIIISDSVKTHSGRLFGCAKKKHIS